MNLIEDECIREKCQQSMGTIYCYAPAHSPGPVKIFVIFSDAENIVCKKVTMRSLLHYVEN